MHRLLARGPAFRAKSFLWPTETATEISASRSTREQGEIGEGAKKKLPLDLALLRNRHRRKDIMKILIRQVGVIFQVNVAVGKTLRCGLMIEVNDRHDMLRSW